MNAAAILETRELSKTYGAGAAAIHAVRGVSLSVPQGVVFGLLGPNGAGKSTLLRMLLGLVRPSAGQYLLFGETAHGPAALRRVGALIETPALYPFLTARETLEALARTSGFRERGRIDAVLRLVGLDHAADRLSRGFSLGMKQRLGIAAALLARPQLLILDEPINGMDPAGILEMRALLRGLVESEGMTVIVSSHLLDEAQRVCDHLAILDRGQLVAQGAVNTLIGRSRLHIDAAPLDRAQSLIGGEIVEGALILDAERSAAPELLRRLIDGGVAVSEARWSTPRLEDAFFEHTGAAQ